MTLCPVRKFQTFCQLTQVSHYSGKSTHFPAFPRRVHLHKHASDETIPMKYEIPVRSIFNLGSKGTLRGRAYNHLITMCPKRVFP